MKKLAWAAIAVASLSGCQTAANTSQEQLLFVRTDGQRGTGNPALEQQYNIDSTICIGEVQKSAVGAPVIYYQGLAGAISAAMYQNQQSRAMLDIMKGCMAGKGYVLVPKSQALAVSQSFRKKS